MVTPSRPKAGMLRSTDSPDVSVNAPRIDKIAEFHLAFPDDRRVPIHQTSSTSAKCSSSSMDSVNRSITKDMVTVQTVEKTITRTDSSGKNSGVLKNGSEHLEQTRSSLSSSESRQQRFDTSSYRQRAEALEGLLEFSARLLQDNRYEELGVLLKPFGPETVSPRETAIWLAKSFKETHV